MYVISDILPSPRYIMLAFLWEIYRGGFGREIPGNLPGYLATFLGFSRNSPEIPRNLKKPWGNLGKYFENWQKSLDFP